MERIADISQRTCNSSHLFFITTLTKINLWLQLLNKTSWWGPSSRIYCLFLFSLDVVLTLLATYSSWVLLISKRMCTFHHPLTYFSFCSHFSGLCYFPILYSAKICTHILPCAFWASLYWHFPRFLFWTLFPSLHCWSYHCIVLLDWPTSVYHLSCVSFPHIFPKSTLDIFSFYSHRASSLLPLATRLLISLSLVYLHLNSCIHTKNIIFLFYSNFQ